MLPANGEVYHLPYFDCLDIKSGKTSNFTAQVPTFDQDAAVSVNGKADKTYGK